MLLIRDVIQRDLSRRIEEIIKVDQADEAVVYEELSEYVVTGAISDYYHRVLTAMAEAPTTLSEAVGIWVSGFFGSGKSSFIKNLGYALEDPQVLGKSAAAVFKGRVNDHRVGDVLDSIHARFPVKVIMFDVQSDRAVEAQRRSIAHYLYRVLLRELGYAEDFDLAELEMALESDSRLEEFRQRVNQRYGQPWEDRRKLALKINEASAVLHEMDPSTYPAADSWAKGLLNKTVEATPNRVVQKSYDLVARRFPGHALVYIVDEVGQYVADSSDRIEDLRSVVELLGKEGRNRIQRGQAVAPIWLVATSQERLDEVVSAIGERRVQLAKVQDRFPIRVDLSPTDIKEIVVKRVLEKKPEHQAAILELYQKHEGAIKTHTALERTHRRQDLDVQSFASFHPYLPHHIDSLSIDIVSGIRRQPGADRTIGGATRTIVKQAYEMLVNPRTNLAEAPLGTLVTLDKLYELLEGSLASEVRQEVADVDQKFAPDPWCGKVIRTVALLSLVRDLPRTPKNIAALLFSQVDAPSSVADVEAAIRQLVQAQHLHEAEDGYKLLTVHEKTWLEEKRGQEVKRRQREELLAAQLGQILGAPAFKAYRYKTRTFPITPAINTNPENKSGGLSLVLRSAGSPEQLVAAIEAARLDSRTTSHVYWVCALTPEIDAQIAEAVRADEMIRKYDRLRADGKITPEERSSLDEEKRQLGILEDRLRGRLLQSTGQGQLLYKGRARDVSSLGQTPVEAVPKFLSEVVPDLYPNFDDGAVTPGANDIENLLKAANLDHLPQMYGASGLKLFLRSEGAVTFNSDATVVRHVLGYLKERVDYGEKPTGRDIEAHFGAPSFGWESDTLRAILAGLFRGGALRVTTRGRTYETYADSDSWPAFTRIPDFRAASFAPQIAPDVGDLVRAREAYIALTGQAIDADQQQISRALGDLVGEELQTLTRLASQAREHRLPILESLASYEGELEALKKADSQKRVQLLAQEGEALKRRKEEVARLQRAVTDDNLRSVNRACAVLDNVWPALQRAGADDHLSEAAAQLSTMLGEPTLFASLRGIEEAATELQDKLAEILERAHHQRNVDYEAAIERLRDDEAMGSLAADDRAALFQPLEAHLCHEFGMPVGRSACGKCGASLEQLEADIAAVDHYVRETHRRLAGLIAPEKPRVVVRAADYFRRIQEPEDLPPAIEAFQEAILKALASGSIVIVE